MIVSDIENQPVSNSFDKSNKNFILMVFGRLISELGTSIFVFSISLYVLNSTKSAALYSTVLSFSILPNILTNIIGGSIVDRCNKKKLIVFSDLVSGIVIFTFLAFFKLFPSNILIIIIFNMLLTTVQGLFSLTMTSSIANVVNEKQVPKLNSVFTGFGSAISIAGPFLGVVIFEYFNMSVIFAINGASFIISGLLEVFIVFYNQNSNEETVKKAGNILKDYKKVMVYLKDTVKVRFLLIINSFIALVFAPIGAIIVPYVSYNVINVSEFQLAVIQGSLAAGAIIASFLMTLITSVQYIFKRLYLFIHLQTAGIFLLCLPYFIPAGNSKWPVTVIFSVCLIFLGIVAVVRSIPISAYFQISISEGIRGRFFGFQNTLLTLFSFLGMWLYGVILDKIPWIYLVLVSGIGSVIFIGLIQLRDRQNKIINMNEYSGP